MGERKDWRGMMTWAAELLERKTGDDLSTWNHRVRASGIDDEAELRAWLSAKQVTGYAQMLLVMERFGYPPFLTATPDELLDGQYADRPHLRPVADLVIDVAQTAGKEVTVQVRKTYVSLVGPRRTFAQVVPSTKSRVDLGLRLDVPATGRLLPAKNLGNRDCPVRIGFATTDEVDDEVVDLLRRAYDANL
jgi:hypothetical protein